MLQKQFAKTLDKISTIYIRSQKKGPPRIYFEGGMKEFLEKERADDPYVFFGNPGVVPDVRMRKMGSRRGYSIHCVSYESFVETPHKRNNTVHGRLYEIAGRPDAPTVVVLHGWHMESYHFFDYYCRLLVRNGFNALLVDLPYHMERRAPNSFHGEFTFSDDPVLTILAMKQAVLDVEGMINWLRGPRGVPQVGMFGVSFGAMLCGLVGCVEPGVDFMMLVVPPADLFDFFTQSRLGRVFESQNPGMFEEMKRNKEVFDRISLVNLKPKMPPEKILLVLADYDGMVRSVKIDELWYAWERPHMERYKHGHLSVILFNPSMNRDMRRWLKTVKAPSAGG